MDSTIFIEKNIPIPKGKRDDPYIKNALCSMACGDSFLVKTQDDRNCVGVIAKRLGIKITTRKVENGIRIWKIASQDANRDGVCIR